MRKRDGSGVDWELYRWILSFPEGLPHWLYKREVARYVSSLTEEQRQDLRDRRYEILEKWADWLNTNYHILRRLGMSDREAELLKDKRLNSPGMRNVLIRRAKEVYGRKMG